MATHAPWTFWWWASINKNGTNGNNGPHQLSPFPSPLPPAPPPPPRRLQTRLPLVQTEGGRGGVSQLVGGTPTYFAEYTWA